MLSVPQMSFQLMSDFSHGSGGHHLYIQLQHWERICGILPSGLIKATHFTRQPSNVGELVVPMDTQPVEMRVHQQCSSLSFVGGSILRCILYISQTALWDSQGDGAPVAHSGEPEQCTLYWLFPLPCFAFHAFSFLLPGIISPVNYTHSSPCLKLCFGEIKQDTCEYTANVEYTDMHMNEVNWFSSRIQESLN